jgi:hypothetical protein
MSKNLDFAAAADVDGAARKRIRHCDGLRSRSRGSPGNPPSGEGREFTRRGFPYEDAIERQIRQLGLLGVTDIVQITRTEVRTEAQGPALPPWCDQHQYRAIVFVVATSHSRRLRWVLDRIMKGHPTRVTVRPACYSRFDPDRWWETRRGIRTEIVELQKLVFETVLHPMSFWHHQKSEAVCTQRVMHGVD